MVGAQTNWTPTTRPDRRAGPRQRAAPAAARLPGLVGEYLVWPLDTEHGKQQSTFQLSNVNHNNYSKKDIYSYDVFVKPGIGYTEHRMHPRLAEPSSPSGQTASDLYR